MGEYMRRIRLTPSFVVAVLALVVATAGVATAAGYIITSTKQIKPSVRRALKGNRGPRGFQGSQGVQGVQGPSGITSVQVVNGPAAPYGPASAGAGAVA